MTIHVDYFGISVFGANGLHGVVAVGVAVEEEGGFEPLDEPQQRLEAPVRDIFAVVYTPWGRVGDQYIQVAPVLDFLSKQSGVESEQDPRRLPLGVLVWSVVIQWAPLHTSKYQ